MSLTGREVRSITFNNALRGYSVEEVDDFLDILAEAMDHLERGQTPRLTVLDVEQQVFPTSFGGYDLDEVDEFLDRAVAALNKRLPSTTVTAEVDESRPPEVSGPGLRADHPVPVRSGGRAWMWGGTVLLTLSALLWAVIIGVLIDEPTEIGQTLLETAAVTGLPFLLGVWALRKGRWSNARRAHSIPRLWTRIGASLAGLGLLAIISSAIGFEAPGRSTVGASLLSIGLVIWVVFGFVRARRRQFGVTTPLLVTDPELRQYSSGLLEARARLINTGGETLRDPVLEPFRYRREWVLLSGQRPLVAELRPHAEVSYRGTIGPVTDPKAWEESIDAGSWGLLATFVDPSGQEWEQLFYV